MMTDDDIYLHNLVKLISCFEFCSLRVVHQRPQLLAVQFSQRIPLRNNETWTGVNSVTSIHFYFPDGLISVFQNYFLTTASIVINCFHSRTILITIAAEEHCRAGVFLSMLIITLPAPTPVTSLR